MAHCINTKHPEYRNLIDKVPFGQRELKARIATWQEITGEYFQYPTVIEVANLHDIYSSEGTLESSDTRVLPASTVYDYMRNTFPMMNTNIVEDVARYMIGKNKAHLISDVVNKIESMRNSLEVDNNYRSNLNELMNIFTTPEEINTIAEENNAVTYFDRIRVFKDLADKFEAYEFDKSAASGKTKEVFDRIEGLLTMRNRTSEESVKELFRQYYSTNSNVYKSYEEDLNRYENSTTSETAWNGRQARMAKARLQSKFPKQVVKQYKTFSPRTGSHRGKTAVTFSVSRPQPSDYGIVSNTYSRDAIAKMQEYRTNIFGDRGVISIKEYLESISNTSELAKVLLSYINDSNNIDIILSDEVSLNIDGKLAKGIYNRDESGSSITLSLSGSNHATAIHEIIHVLTADYIRNNQDSQLVKDLNALYEYAASLPELSKFYGLKDTFEFVSEMFSNLEFQEALANARPTPESKGYKNLFRQLWDKIAEFFGFKSKNSLLDQSLAIGSHVLDKASIWINNADFTDKGLDNSTYTLMNEVFEETSSSGMIENIYDASGPLKKISTIYNSVQIKDITDTLTYLFSDTIDMLLELDENKHISRSKFFTKFSPFQVFEEIRNDLIFVRDEYSSNPELIEYTNNLTTVIDNFSDFIRLAINDIARVEGIRISNDMLDYEKVVTYSISEESETDTEQEDFDYNNEERILESWQFDSLNTSVNNGLSVLVRKVIRNIPLLTNRTDSNGDLMPQINLLGYEKMMDSGIVMNRILKFMQNIKDAEHFVDSIDDFIKDNTWAIKLKEELDTNDEFFSQFFSALFKHHTSFGVTKQFVDEENGTSYKTMHDINISDNAMPYIQEWQHTMTNSLVINDKTSIYDSDGSLNIPNIKKNRVLINKLIKDWNSAKTVRRASENSLDKRIEFINNNFDNILGLMQSVGISISEANLLELLQDSMVETSKNKFNLDLLLNSIGGIHMYTNKLIESNSKIDNPSMIINNNNNNYRRIANIITSIGQEYVESNVNQGGKNYYSYQQPNYLTKTIQALQSYNSNDPVWSKWLEDNFTKYVGTLYNEDGTYNIHWLNEIINNEKDRKILDHKIELMFNRKTYSQLSDTEYQQLLLAQYFSSKDVAYYHVPILAEAPVARFIKFKKYVDSNYKNTISKILTDTVFMQEINRILTITPARKQGIIEGTIAPIKNYDGSLNSDNTWNPGMSESFQMLRMLNPYLKEIKDMYKSESSSATGLSPKLLQFVQDKIIEGLDNKVKAEIANMTNINVIPADPNKIKNSFKGLKYGDNKIIDKDSLEEAIGEYIYNSVLATANIIQLTTTDLSFYNYVEDFQKRFKQVHSGGMALNTQARYKGKRIGKDTERYIVLSDQYKPSSEEFINEITEIFENNPNISKEEAQRNIDLYKSNNLTDAQAFRFLDSAKALIAMHKGWNDELENSFQRLKKGEWSMEDYNLINQAFKPFTYTQHTVDSGVQFDVEDASKGNYILKVPTQHKNSEIILIPQHAEQFKSGKLKALIEVMGDSSSGGLGIDVIMFESAVKVGLQNAVDINDMEDSKDIVKYIKDLKDEVIQEVNYNDVAIQQPVPEHLQDTTSLYGTQTRAHVMSNVTSDMEFEIDGKKYDGDAFKKLYNNLITENLLESYQDLIQEFGNIESLQKILQDEILSNDIYSNDLLHALEIKNGKFVLPLFEPSQASRIEQLFNSIWKKRLTKQKIHGGKVVNASSFGLDENLEIKFSRDSNGNLHIDYMEVIMPFPSSILPVGYESYLDTKTGIMNVDAMIKEGLIDPELLEAIAYRIPTEDKYSIWPIKIKYFYHRSGGGSIIAPKEISTIIGLDFDVDSMYLMLKDFNLTNIYDNTRAKKDYDKIKDDSKGTFKEWFKDKKSEYLIKQKFAMDKYDINSFPKDMTKTQRDNMLIDITTQALRNPKLSALNISPGNFDTLKATSRRLNLLNNPNLKYTWDELSKMSLKELKDITSKLEASSMDIMFPSTQVSLFKNNMIAGQLIGIIANHASHHAIAQGSGLSIAPRRIKVDNNWVEIPRFKINGKYIKTLDSILSPSGEYISTLLGNAAAASVDAVKDPVLDGMNYNTHTADVAMLLTRLGYNSDEIGLFLRQPAVMEWVRAVESGKTSSEALKSAADVLIKYSELSGKTSGDSELFISTMAKAINDYSKRLTNPNIKLKDFYKTQTVVLEYFESLLRISGNLASVVGATRAHTGKGGVGPKMIDNIINMNKVNDLAEIKLLNNPFVVKKYNRFHTNNSIEELRDWLDDKNYTQAFTTLGWEAPNHTFAKYFPQFSTGFTEMLKDFPKSVVKNKRAMESIYKGYMSYFTSQFEGFSGNDAERMLFEFPKEFMQLKKDYPKLNELKLISSIVLDAPTDVVPISMLRFKSSGKLNNLQKENIQREWETLLLDPTFAKLAQDLYKYNQYTTGLWFGPKSFSHFTPTNVKTSLSEFSEGLSNMHNKTYVGSNMLSNIANYLSELDIASLTNLDGIYEVIMDNTLYKMQVIGEYLEIPNLHDKIFRIDEVSENVESNTIRLRFTPIPKSFVMSSNAKNAFLDQFYRNNLDNKQFVPDIRRVTSSENAEKIISEIAKIGYVERLGGYISNTLDNVINPENSDFDKDYIMIPDAQGKDRYYKIEENILSLENLFILKEVTKLGDSKNLTLYDYDNTSFNSPITNEILEKIKAEETEQEAYNRELYREAYSDITLIEGVDLFSEGFNNKLTDEIGDKNIDDAMNNCVPFN